MGVRGQAREDRLSVAERVISREHYVMWRPNTQGYYARAGIDFAINNRQHLGFGVRYMSTELDFDKTVGNIDIEGPQYVLTFSTRL